MGPWEARQAVQSASSPDPAEESGTLLDHEREGGGGSGGPHPEAAPHGSESSGRSVVALYGTAIRRRDRIVGGARARTNINNLLGTMQGLEK